VAACSGKKGSDAGPVDAACGADAGSLCAVGEACTADSDCQSNACRIGACAMSSETDVGCGGLGNPPCAAGKACQVASDCIDKVCKANLCKAATNTDEVKNGNETDVDCGGTGNLPCALGDMCLVSADCASNLCPAATLVCTMASDHDGIKDGNETDVDCGGSDAKKCDVGKTCKAHTDCVSNGCDWHLRCADAPSCGAVVPGETKGIWGRQTCGPNEYDYPEPASPSAQDSCCRAKTVASIGGTAKMDVYPITAGRMRTFLERVNYDVLDFVKSLPPGSTAWDPTWNDLIPGNGMSNQWLSQAYDALGPGTSTDQGPGDRVHSRDGCSIGGLDGTDGGMRTYYWDFKGKCAPGDKYCINENSYGYPQYVYDTKPLNCVETALVAAFCAWDGGRLASFDEIEKAYSNGGAQSFPWGNQDPTKAPPAGWQGNTPYNYAYTWPTMPPMVTPWFDTKIVNIAAPGRMPKDANPDGIVDLAGNVFHLVTASTDVRMGWHMPFWSGSWQGHPIPDAKTGMLTASAVGASYANLAWQTTENQAYWAVGARCMR
jgi:hypothetical protein